MDRFGLCYPITRQVGKVKKTCYKEIMSNGLKFEQIKQVEVVQSVIQFFVIIFDILIP